MYSAVKYKTPSFNIRWILPRVFVFSSTIRQWSRGDGSADLVTPIAEEVDQTVRRAVRTRVDDLRIAALLSPPLTTIRQPIRELARTAIEVLVQRLNHPNSPTRKTYLDAPLIIRASTGPT